MRDERRDRDNRDNNRNEGGADPRWLHGHHHGQNSDRGNYARDSHFNRGYGNNAYSQWGDDSSFNSNADQQQMSPQGRFQAGGAQYSGEDYTRRGNSNSDNPYGMTYMKDDGHNSQRHYDARADYGDHDYSDFGNNGPSNYRYGMADERFGHDVRRGGNEGNWARGSRGDYESFRRNEQGNRNYDNDYSTGFAGRNFTEGETQFGEGSRYSDMNQRRGENDRTRDRYDDYMRDRDRR